MPSSTPTPDSLLIVRTMRVSEIVALLPQSEKLLGEYGMHCVGCQYNGLDTLEEGCHMHGFSDDDVDELLVELNTLAAEVPARPQTLTITKEAAEGLKEVLKAQGHEGKVLEVDIDERGGFCMEVRDETPKDAMTFTHREVPDIRIVAVPLALARIGGATIDFRDGRFKLDLPEDNKMPGGCACANGGTCGCTK